MTTRERILKLLNYEKPDRVPAVLFGFWRELLDEWEEQGVVKNGFAKAWGFRNEADYEILGMLGADCHWSCFWGGNEFLSPPFEYKVIEKRADGVILQQNGYGVIEAVKPGLASIPGEHDYLLKDRGSFEKYYKHRLQPDPSRVDLKHLQDCWNKRDKNQPFGIWLGSLLGKTREMLTLTGISYLMADDEDLFAEICDMVGEICYTNAKITLEYAKNHGIVFDHAGYWEDICFKNGPLLSPAAFERYCGKHYKRINGFCRGYGIKYISLDCDGVIDMLVPTWLNNGVNVMFPLEVGVWGDQFEAARKKYGKNFLGVGSMDKTALRKDKAAVDEELKRVQKLIKLGGYVPCPDHLLMPGTKFELVKYYFEKLKELSL